MESLSRFVMGNAIDVPCPHCQYPIWVVWAEVAARVSVICPCCRVTIRLVDETGSVQTAPEQMQAALDGLESALRGIFS